LCDFEPAFVESKSQFGESKHNAGNIINRTHRKTEFILPLYERATLENASCLALLYSSNSSTLQVKYVCVPYVYKYYDIGLYLASITIIRISGRKRLHVTSAKFLSHQWHSLAMSQCWHSVESERLSTVFTRKTSYLLHSGF